MFAIKWCPWPFPCLMDVSVGESEDSVLHMLCTGKVRVMPGNQAESTLQSWVCVRPVLQLSGSWSIPYVLQECSVDKARASQEVCLSASLLFSDLLFFWPSLFLSRATFLERLSEAMPFLNFGCEALNLLKTCIHIRCPSVTCSTVSGCRGSSEGLRSQTKDRED